MSLSGRRFFFDWPILVEDNELSNLRKNFNIYWICLHQPRVDKKSSIKVAGESLRINPTASMCIDGRLPIGSVVPVSATPMRLRLVLQHGGGR